MFWLEIFRKIGNLLKINKYNLYPQEVKQETKEELYAPSSLSDNAQFQGKIALVLPPGNVTGGAMQVGCLLALKDKGLLDKVTFFSAGSVGALNSAMAMVDRIEELKKLWLSIEPKDVIYPKSIWNIIYSNIAAWIAEAIESWQRTHPAKIKITKPYYISKRVLIFAISFGLAATLFYFENISFFIVVPATIVFLHILRLFFKIVSSVLWYGFRIGIFKILLGKFRKFLENPELHTNSLNEFSLEKTVEKLLDFTELQKEIINSPKRLVVGTVNAIEWRLEVYSFGQGKAERIDVTPAQPISPDLIKNIIFASASIPVVFPLYRIENNWYYDSAGLKPMPLSYAFDSECDLILVFANEPDIKGPLDKSYPSTIFQTIIRVTGITQREMVKRELQIAREKAKDLRVLNEMVFKIKQEIIQKISAPQIRDNILQAINKYFNEADFSFKRDKDITTILISPPWEPAIETTLLGRFKDFSLIPDLIERGYKYTLEVLQREGIVN